MLIGSKIIFHETLSSTNTEARDLLRTDDYPEGTVIHTLFQNSGRGQAGNIWISEKGKNLLFSIILYPRSIEPRNQFMLSMAISLGIYDFLDIHTGGCSIKWPNDIILNERKIAGILIENSILGDEMENSIAGIGLNINQENFGDIFPEPASLKKSTGKEFDINTCLKEILATLDGRYKQLLYGDRKQIRKEYLTRLWRYMEWHDFQSGGQLFRGRIKDVGDDGTIAIVTETGDTRSFSFKEVSYLP
ncbi:MAG TPA: biotin--[acetyl-CoA-carboxylase] ligase [Bacteroidales bacterium]|nr:biotin--[acetyl-CoA-carboxylase] ligase [Bacteroidales bacterium]HPF03387.1 biotin--[acetyl-CoA-carboxylase] ligase [Bacteroidales bacterium]HPJ59562.1 biotin--[acetyl-CoA-carboxylase] ligase [Bacteroidales bacterium]HPR12977.1 biotin--[acetyl-CoA-carboxylase] ligase [Bacteroidales bacterium]HRW84697.1 biotin--[acetyl-CoA-carboxylase] ligase [Bacteroidales bacterium]